MIKIDDPRWDPIWEAVTAVDSVGWTAEPGSVALLTALCLGLVPALAWLLRRRWTTAGVVAALGVLVVVPPPSPGWPPPGWVAVACDVGQGDALVLAAGPGRAVVVDAGPDPVPVQRCLDRLGVRVFHIEEVRRRGLDTVLGESVAIATRGTSGFGISIDLDYPIHRYFLWLKHAEFTLGAEHVSFDPMPEGSGRTRGPSSALASPHPDAEAVVTARAFAARHIHGAIP